MACTGLSAPPWHQIIFRQDRGRKQSFEEAVQTYEAMVATYTEYGYELVEIQRVPVENRVSFVLQDLPGIPPCVRK